MDGPPPTLGVVTAARSDAELVVLEGFHAVKHALRFGAQVDALFVSDGDAVRELARALAPDLLGVFTTRAVSVDEAELRRIAPEVHTHVVAVARRPPAGAPALLDAAAQAPIVLLEDPRHLGNVGAAIRVAAAAGAAGVLTTGPADPWAAAALRGSAGLHFALPVDRVPGVAALATRRPLLGLTPDGAPFAPDRLPAGAVLAFGTERAGLSPELLERCDARLALPMRAGVSSLNLATTVAAVLFAWRLSGGWPG